jgi:hypothetical protein
MSRRGRHGRHQHSSPVARSRPAGQAFDRPTTSVEAPDTARPEADSAGRPDAVGPVETPVIMAASVAAPVAPPVTQRVAPPVVVPAVATPMVAPAPPAISQPAASQSAALRQDGPWEPPRPTCTAPQLRRFIKSRPWIPMHELRRRFGIFGTDDDVTPIRVGGHLLFIGLPAAEGALMGELLDGGDVGYELSLDPETPIVIGVYPMRPVPRG